VVVLVFWKRAQANLRSSILAVQQVRYMWYFGGSLHFVLERLFIAQLRVLKPLIIWYIAITENLGDNGF
jgi:hypothetical protein